MYETPCQTWRRCTCCPSKVSAPMSHVEVDGACAVGICQDLTEAVCQHLGAGVGHLLAPVHQPARAAKKAPLTTPTPCLLMGFE